MLNWFKNNLLLGCIYIVLCLAIGENHPFSLMAMYDSFPDKACSFYLTGYKDSLLPLQKNFAYKTADLTHNYYAICNQKKINGGNDAETPQQLDSVGQAMWLILKPYCLTEYYPAQIKLHQVYYFLKGDSICSKDKVMYEFKNS